MHVVETLGACALVGVSRPDYVGKISYKESGHRFGWFMRWCTIALNSQTYATCVARRFAWRMYSNVPDVRIKIGHCIKCRRIWMCSDWTPVPIMLEFKWVIAEIASHRQFAFIWWFCSRLSLELNYFISVFISYVSSEQTIHWNRNQNDD